MDVFNVRNAASIAGLLAISCYLVWHLGSLVSFSSTPVQFQPANVSSSLYFQAGQAIHDVPYAQIEPPAPERLSDITDTFANYTKSKECSISSLDLHMPFSPLCPDRASVLEAMTNGGRFGFDAPFVPRGCDMRWYSSEEACEILSRFHRVIIVGDSLLRQVANAMWIFLRADLEHGAINEARVPQELKFDPKTEYGKVCHCHGQFAYKPCSMLLFRKGKEAFDAIPEKLVCKPGSFDLHYYDGQKWPLTQENLDEYMGAFPKTKPTKPVALLLDHCLHNNANLTITGYYVNKFVREMNRTIPWLSDPDSNLYLPKLYSSSNSGQWQKVRGMERQNMNNLARFERDVRPMVEKRGFEFLGAWNMSITATSFDGLHLALEGNLLKAMMFLNWLDKLDQPVPVPVPVSVESPDLQNGTLEADESVKMEDQPDLADDIPDQENVLDTDDGVEIEDETDTEEAADTQEAGATEDTVEEEEEDAVDIDTISDPAYAEDPTDPSAVLAGPDRRRRSRFRRYTAAKIG